MKITFLGAAQEVTGSCYLVETEKHKFMVDCGLFQGSKELEQKNHDDIDFREVEFMLLTHAHIDHTGRIPLLYKNGFRKPIYCTKAT
ncbi:MAG: MBL fold metallo-hydrolase [Finegoldia magna]|nr:MBL fold metallo-hydrolase [Finegoldia magna]